MKSRDSGFGIRDSENYYLLRHSRESGNLAPLIGHGGDGSPLSRGRRWNGVRAKNLARLRRIAIDLLHHRIEIGELRLVAELRRELDVDAFAVEIAVEIEEVRFQQRLGAIDGRPDA